MTNLGFKIVDRHQPEIAPIVERALAEGCPLEVGFYFADPGARAYLAETLPGSGIPVNAHLDHRQLGLLGIESQEPALREQLELAAGIGARFVVTHLGNYPMTARPAHRPVLWDRLDLGLARAESLARDYGLAVHLENTFHPLSFYRELCQALATRRERPPDLCFDLGHAKVWSTETLDDWMGFLQTQTAAGARLHLHLHANRGLVDEHLSFVTARRLGIAGADAFTQGRDWFQALAALDRAFPAATKVFEVPSAEAIENFELVTGVLESSPKISSIRHEGTKNAKEPSINNFL